MGTDPEAEGPNGRRFLITPLKWFVRDEPVHVIYKADICLRIFIFTLSVRLLNYLKLASKEGFNR